MIVITKETTTPTLDVSIWANDHEVGTCFLDTRGHMRAQAIHVQDQEELNELLRVEFAIQKKRAREDGNRYTPTTFLTDLPRIFRGYYSAQRVRPQPLAISAPFAFKRFDPAKIPTLPRRRQHA